MAQTKIADLINPEVVAQMIRDEYINKIRFANSVAQLQMDLVNRPGDTITIPVWAYIGDAADLAEGVEDVPVVLEASSTTATVKKAAKSLELTDEAMLAGYGDPMTEATQQLALSIAKKVDADVLVELKKATLVAGDEDTAISFNGVAAAIAKFEDEETGVDKWLFVNPAQYAELLQDAKFIVAAPEIARTGVVGFFAGCNVSISNQLEDGEAIIAKPNAVQVYLKRDVNVETQRNILAKSTYIAADEHYVAVLRDASKAVKYTVKPTV